MSISRVLRASFLLQRSRARSAGSAFLSAAIMSAGLLAAGLSTNCHADLLVFQEGSGGYFGTQDTYLLSSSPTSIRGALPIVDVLGPGIRESHGLLRFDEIFGAGPNQIQAGSVITSATLRLFTSFTTANTVTMHEMLIDWSEDDATWTSLGAGVQANDIEARQLAVAGFDAPGAFVDIDITASLRNWSNGANNFGWAFLISAMNTDSYAFSTSEFSTQAERPQLTVNFSPVPEPATATILGLMLTGLATRAGVRSVREKRRQRGN